LAVQLHGAVPSPQQAPRPLSFLKLVGRERIAVGNRGETSLKDFISHRAEAMQSLDSDLSYTEKPQTR